MIDFTTLVKRCFIFFLGLLQAFALSAQSEDHGTDNWIPNSSPNRVEHSNGATMLSGSFTSIGPYTGSAVMTDLVTGQTLDPQFPKVNGDVYVTTPDGSGGWYMGGYFSAVDTVKVNNLVHIKADKSIDRTWKPNPDNTPSALTVSGSTLYVGGYFNEIAGQTRNYVASFDIPTGNLTSWNPNANNGVQVISVSGATVYLGGYFTTIGGLARSRLAAVSATTGLPTTWAPVVNGVVLAMVLETNSIFIGGSFTSAGGSARTGLARINLADNFATTWLVSTNSTGYVEDLVLSGNTLFIGGSFSTINGVARNSLASVLVSTATVSTWDPSLPALAYISDMALQGSTLYFCGSFDAVGASIRTDAAAVDAISGTLLSWGPSPNGSLTSISTSTTGILLGGYQNGMNWVNRNGFALLLETSANPWPFDIDLNGGIVNTIAKTNNVLYIGGRFDLVNKTPRQNLAAIDLTTGQLLPWNPSVFGLSPADRNVSVNSMEIKDNLLYIGGKFLTVNTSVRSGLAAININTGVVDTWDPSLGDGKTTDQFVNSIDVTATTVYVGGSFNLIGGGSQVRGNLAAIDLLTGSILPWDPNSLGIVDKIKVTATTAYVIGEFGNGVGGQVRPYRIAALNLNSNTATIWNPQFAGSVNDLALSVTDVYVGGYFDDVDSQFRPGLASFSLQTGNLNSWTPDVGDNGDGGYSITTLAASSSRLYVGGSIRSFGLEERTDYGEYSICPSPPIVTFEGTTLSTTANGSLQWYENGFPVEGATGQTFEIRQLENGSYYVALSAGGCIVNSDEVTYFVTEPELTINKELGVYPNPVQSDLFIKIPSTKGEVDLTLMDMTGRTIKTVKGDGDDHRLSMNDVDAGPYLLIIRSQKKKHVQKIIKIN